MTCPYISTSDEGTSYCKLAEDSVNVLEEKVKKYKLALMFYADQHTWEGDPEKRYIRHENGKAIIQVRGDAGEIAREALKN